MHAAVLREFGEPPRFAEFTEPEAGEGEVVVEVRAAALHRIDRARASGGHYAGPRELPTVCGIDGVGSVTDEDGDETRVWFALPRAPFGSMAERAVVSTGMIAPVADELTDAEAAALINPGQAALLPLRWRGRLAEGETVLILGATGVTGRLAVQLAKILGAGRVVAAGRNPRALEELAGLGADALIRLDQPRDRLVADFAAQAGATGYQVVVDYVWGEPTEALLAALTRHGFEVADHETRLVQVGDLAAPAISLRAQALRSAPITLTGSGGFAPRDVRAKAYGDLITYASEGRLHIAVEEQPLAEVGAMWRRGDVGGRRVVLVP
jgi:NADPH:quinone reductase-like Zn-dependent oxidoreductase